MNGPEIITAISADIERQLHSHRSQAPTKLPHSISPWLAVALLQKAIRRGETGWALGAAQWLLASAPERLWRRLAVIAVEDVGLGDLDAVYTAIVAATQRKHLAIRYGGWKLASLVVTRLATAAKCRATDDLHAVTEECKEWTEHRLELAEKPFSDLLAIIASDDPIERRAIALRYAVGTTYPKSKTLIFRRGHPTALFDFLCEAGYPHTLVEISRSAYRQTGEVISAFLPLLYREFEGADTEIRSDEFPPETTVNGIPCWTFDMFSREGRVALTRFLKTDCASTDWLRLHVQPRDRTAVIGYAVFQVESGLVADRLIWPVGERLRHQADFHVWPFPPDQAVEFLSLLRSDIGILNGVRANVR